MRSASSTSRKMSIVFSSCSLGGVTDWGTPPCDRTPPAKASAGNA